MIISTKTAPLSSMI